MPEEDSTTSGTAVPLLSAILEASAGQASDVLVACTPDEVQLVDAPTATILDVVLDLAQDGKRPAAVTVNAELQRRGLYAGNHGSLIQARMLDAASPAHPPEMLPELASAVLATVFRARMQATGEALVQGAQAAPEIDLWTVLLRAGTQARELRARLAAVRGEGVAA